MNTTLRIAKYAVRDLMRSRWLAAYAAFFLVATFALLQFSDNEAKAMLSLVNVVLLIVPLANVVFGTMYLQSSREFVELLLAQPIRRRQLFSGLYLGLTAPVSLAVVAGIGVPLVAMGAARETLAEGAMLAVMATALGAVFQQLLGGATGLAIVLTVFLAWTALPALLGARLFHRKDF